jgi:hypothetical protein
VVEKVGVVGDTVFGAISFDFLTQILPVALVFFAKDLLVKGCELGVMLGNEF